MLNVLETRRKIVNLWGVVKDFYEIKVKLVIKILTSHPWKKETNLVTPPTFCQQKLSVRPIVDRVKDLITV